MDIVAFKEKLITGEILPSKVEKKFDSKGPIMMLDYPKYKLRVHMHFNDEKDYEQTGRSHIKSYDGKHLEFVNSREVALIRLAIEQEAKPKDIIHRIDKKFRFIGLTRSELNNDYFSICYYRKSSFRGNIVFLIVEHYNETISAKEYIDKARLFCKENFTAIRVINDVWLNLVIIHRGELAKNDISGVPDWTGLHRTIVRSVTLINIVANEIIQVSFGTNFFFNASTLVSKAVKSLKGIFHHNE